MKRFAIVALLVYAAAPIVVAVFFTSHGSSMPNFLASNFNGRDGSNIWSEPAMQPRRGADWATFGNDGMGMPVTVSIDGRNRPTYAGKLRFQDDKHSWESVCADVSSPIMIGDSYEMKKESSIRHGGNIAKAGRIVAKYFKQARTPEQCAGLQIAVWTAIEEGTPTPNFNGDHFRVEADPVSLRYARYYYSAVNQKAANCDIHGPVPAEKRKDNANLYQAGPEGGQSQLAPAPQQSPKTSSSVS